MDDTFNALALGHLSVAERARIDTAELTGAELAELHSNDERLWGLWLYEINRIRLAEAQGGRPAEMRRALRWAMVLCLATVDPDGPWQRCLDEPPDATG